MTELCTSPLEKSRKALSRVLQAVGIPGKGGALAVAMGVSDSTVSRIKTDQLEGALTMLYHLGFKVVDADRICVKQDELQMLRRTYCRVVENEKVAASLFGDDE